MRVEETKHPLYPYTEEEKQEIRKELCLKESAIQSDIDAILDWFKKQPHLVNAGISKFSMITSPVVCVFYEGKCRKLC